MHVHVQSEFSRHPSIYLPTHPHILITAYSVQEHGPEVYPRKYNGGDILEELGSVNKASMCE